MGVALLASCATTLGSPLPLRSYACTDPSLLAPAAASLESSSPLQGAACPGFVMPVLDVVHCELPLPSRGVA